MSRYILIVISVALASSLYAGQTGSLSDKAQIEEKGGSKLHKVAVHPRQLTPEEQELQALNEQLKSLEEAAMREIKALSENVETLTPGEREDVNKRIEEIKYRLERESLDIKKRIAELKGDTWLLNQVEEAIDHLDHPEKYRTKIELKEREIPGRSSNESAEEKVQPEPHSR